MENLGIDITNMEGFKYHLENSNLSTYSWGVFRQEMVINVLCTDLAWRLETGLANGDTINHIITPSDRILLDMFMLHYNIIDFKLQNGKLIRY